MTNSEARKRHQAAQAPVSRPNAASVDSGAIGRLSERAVVDALLACLPMHEDGTGHVADCGYDWDATTRCGCYTLPDQLAAIVREHTDRALAEVEQRIEHGPHRLGHNVSVVCSCVRCEATHACLAIVRAARQERGR